MILNNPGPSTCKFNEFEEDFNLKKVKTQKQIQGEQKFLAAIGYNTKIDIKN